MRHLSGQDLLSKAYKRREDPLAKGGIQIPPIFLPLSLSRFADSLTTMVLILSAFDDFKRVFKGDIVTPQDPDYAEAIKRWAVNAARRAKFVAFVKDAEDVSLAIKYATAEKLPIAIRGGGHNPAGSSSSDGGLVVDLSRYINTCRVDPERKLGYVGGGAIWETVDKAAIEYGLATVGGTVNHVRAFSLVHILSILGITDCLFRPESAGRASCAFVFAISVA